MHRIILRYHKHILVFSLFLTLAAIALITRIKLDLNITALLPTDNPSVDAFLEVAETIGIQSTLIAVVEPSPEIKRKDVEAFVECLSEKYSQSQSIEEVEFKGEPGRLSNLIPTLIEHLPQLLKTEGLNLLAEKLTEPEIYTQVSENKKILMTPFGIAAKELVQADPLGLRDLLASSLTLPSGRRTLRPHTGFYRTQQGDYIIFIKPRRPPQDIVFSRNLMAEVASVEKTVRREMAQRLSGPSKKITVSYTGGYPIAVNDEALTKRDIKVTLLTSFIGVMLLFGLSFKTSRILFFVGLPLAAGLVWTLGFASLVFVRLNILTCIFSCVLVGLGIDFAIHIVNRYFAEDKTNMNAAQRLEMAFQEAGTGILVGGITTSVAFLGVGISDFRGFSELGILTGTGILICLLGMFFLLPALLVTFSDSEKTTKTVAIAGFGLKPFLGRVQRYPRRVLAGVAVVVLPLAVFGTGVRFDDNLKNFRPADSEVFRLQDKITDWLGGSTSAILLVAEAGTEAEAVETSAAVYSALDTLRTSKKIAGVRSIGGFFPPPSRQAANREFIRAHAETFDAKRIRKAFDQALVQNGFRVLDVYNPYFESLGRAFAQDKPLLPTDLKEKELQRLLRMFLIKKGGAYKTVTYISPVKDLWSRADTVRFRDLIVGTLEKSGVAEDRYILTGPNMLTGDLKALILQNLKSALRLAGLGIFMVLFVYYRSLKLVLVSMVPLLTGLVSLVGIMALTGIDFNFINLIVIPMIVGIGIDDGVHFANTHIHSDRTPVSKAMFHTGRAVVLTSLTTIVGFGSIALSHYPGLRSMGIVAVIGIGACMIASLVVLPAVFSIAGDRE